MSHKYDTKIFLDSGNPEDTKQAKQMLGFLDGQTTNPSLVAKNPEVANVFAGGGKCSREQLNKFYHNIISQINSLIPGTAISIEVYADKNTTAEEIIKQAREYTAWVDNSYVKVPIIPAGLKAAEVLAQEMQLNFTLCFTQAQAAAVYTVTKGSPYQHFVSPFIGRLDDKGVDGMSLIKNILKMYDGETRVGLLAASIRSVEHIQACLQVPAPYITIPFKLFEPWSQADFAAPDELFAYKPQGEILPYQELDLSKSWQEFDIQHDLTDSGLAKFAQDWNNICHL